MLNLIWSALSLTDRIYIGFMLALSGYSFIKIRKNPKENTTLPNIIAALGIIGTFWGIFLGLLQFDAKQIDKSIPSLLEGMKIAFSTSIIGLVFSNILKAWKSNRTKALETEEEKKLGDEVSLKEIASLMMNIEKAIIESNRKLNENIESSQKLGQETLKFGLEQIGISLGSLISSNNKVAVNIEEGNAKLVEKLGNAEEKNQEFTEKMLNSLVGQSSESLSNQIKIMKDELLNSQEIGQKTMEQGIEKIASNLENIIGSNNTIATSIETGNNELIGEFRIFSEKMAENNMKAFTEAIQECIRDLNNQLQDQFGENFKHLDESVKKLLEWQVNYKETIEKTNQNQIELYTGMEKAKEMLIEISNKSSGIVDVANRLGDKIITLDKQESDLTEVIKVAAEMSQNAKDLVPNIDRYMEKGIENLNETVSKVKDLSLSLDENATKTITSIEKYIKSADDKFMEHSKIASEQITNHVINTTKKGIEEINRSSEAVLNNIETISTKATEEVAKLFGKSSENMDKNITDSIKKIEELMLSVDVGSNGVISNIERISAGIQEEMNRNSIKLDKTRSEILSLTEIATESIKRNQIEVTEAFSSITKEIVNSGKLNVEAIEKQISGLEAAVVKLENESFKLTERISDNIQNMVDNNNTNLQTSVKNLNSNLESALNFSLESLGNQLSLVSGKFVQDYTPLTIELQRLVSIAKKSEDRL